MNNTYITVKYKIFIYLTTSIILSSPPAICKPVQRTEPRFQDTEYLLRQTRLSNYKKNRDLYTSSNDRQYSDTTYQELNRRVPQEQGQNVRQVVTAVQQQQQREIQSTFLYWMKKAKDGMTDEFTETQIRQNYQTANDVIQMRRDLNNARITERQAEMKRIESLPEFRTARNMGIGSLSNKQQQEYNRQLSQYARAEQELEQFQNRSASYDRAQSYVQGVTTIISATEKYEKLKKQREDYLSGITADTRKNGSGGYQLPEERAAELRRDIDYTKDVMAEVTGALTQINKFAADKAKSGEQSADADVRAILDEFRNDPTSFSQDADGKRDQLIERLRDWDDNKNLQRITENISQGLEVTQGVIDKINKAEEIIDKGQKLLTDSRRDRETIGGLQNVPQTMREGMQRYSDMKNVLSAGADYLPEGVVQETAKTGVQVMDTMIQAATFGNQIEESKLQGGRFTESGEALLKDRDFGEESGGLIAREGEDGRWLIPDKSGEDSVELTSEEYGRLQDALSSYTTISGQNPDQDKLAALAASVKNNRPVEIEKYTVSDDGYIEKEIITMNANMLLDPSERDTQEFYRDGYNQTADFFDDALANSTEFNGQSFESLDVRKQSELSEMRKRMRTMMEATGRDPNKLSPTIITSILNQEAELKKKRGSRDPLTDSADLNAIINNDKVQANFTGFERNMIDSLMDKINDPNTPKDKKAEYEALLVSELNRIRAVAPGKDIPPVTPKDPEDGEDKPPVQPPGTEPPDKTDPESPTDDELKPPLTPEDISTQLIMDLISADPSKDQGDIIRDWIRSLAGPDQGNNKEGDLRQSEENTSRAQSTDSSYTPDIKFPDGDYTGWLNNLTDEQIRDRIAEFESVQQSSQALLGDRQTAIDQQQRIWDNELWTQQQNLDDNIINIIRISESVRNQAQFDRENSWGAWIQDLITSSIGSMATGFGGGFGSRIGSNIIEREYEDEFGCDDDCNDDKNKSDGQSEDNSSTIQSSVSQPAQPSRTCSLGPDNNGDGICDICAASMGSSKSQVPQNGRFTL